jgi:hypothetical protein
MLQKPVEAEADESDVKEAGMCGGDDGRNSFGELKPVGMWPCGVRGRQGIALRSCELVVYRAIA